MLALLFSTEVYCIAFTTAEAMSDMTFSRSSRGAFEPAMNTAIATRFPSGELAIPTSFVAVMETYSVVS